MFIHDYNDIIREILRNRDMSKGEYIMSPHFEIDFGKRHQSQKESVNYNILSYGSGYSVIEVNAVGYELEEIEIFVSSDNILNIIGTKKESQNNIDNAIVVKKGFDKLNFNIKEKLSNKSEVTGARLKNGILTVFIKENVPENKQVKINVIKE